MDTIRRGTPLKNVFVDDAKIRLFSEAFGVSIREIARRMGVSHAYLFQVLKGRAISAPRAQRLVEVLGEIARTVPMSPFAFLREAVPGPAQAAGAPMTPVPMAPLPATEVPSAAPLPAIQVA